MKILGEVLRLSTDLLKRRGAESARLDAELLIGAALGLPRLQVYLQHDRPLEEAEVDAIRKLVARRARREPVAHIIGKKEFFGLDFHVRPGLLVPRPDTETLVEALLGRLPKSSETPVYLADVGCGTGCVGLTLAVKLPFVRLYAIDQSPEALACTRENAEALGVRERVGLLKGDLLAALPAERPLDWVVSNPPYVPTRDLRSLSPEIAHFEDPAALDGGPDGLAVIRRLLVQAGSRVRVGLAIEFGAGQSDVAVDLARKAGFQDVRTSSDLAGSARVVTGLVSTQPAPFDGARAEPV
jgi:release factor glutamine methyltransferase